MDLCSVCQGPLGAVHIQPPPTGQPSQALPHSSQLRLALCLHSDADAHAPGRPKVSALSDYSVVRREHETLLYFYFLHIPI